MKQRFLLTLGLISVTAVWGFTFVPVQDAMRDYSALPFMALRYGLAALALLPFATRQVRRQELLVGGFLGVLVAVGLLLQTVGLRTTSVTNSGLITGLYVIFAPLFATLIYRAEITRRVWLAVALSVSGLVLVAGAQPADLHPGDALTLVAASLFGLQIALLSRYSPTSNVAALAFVQLAVPIPLFAAATLATGTAVVPPRLEVWWAIALTGLGASAFGFWMQTYAQQRIPAGRAAVIMAIEPVWAAMAGYFLAGDRLTSVQWTGAGLMLLALFVAEVSPYVKVYRRRDMLARPVVTGADE